MDESQIVSVPSHPTQSPRVTWWLWLNVLSLDAPLVAILWQRALASAHGVSLPFTCDLVLGLAVWLIYLVDHTLDASTHPAPAKLTARHAFYRRNRLLFLYLVIPVTVVLVALLAFTVIPAGIMWRGVVLSFLVGMYLLHFAARGTRWLYIFGNLVMGLFGAAMLLALPLPMPYQWFYGAVLLALFLFSFTKRTKPQGFRLLPKELICGYFFALGSSLCVNFYSLDLYATPLSLETLLFALLCALNCIAISCYERETDALSDPNAITQTWPGIARVYPILLLMAIVTGFYALGQRLSPQMAFYTAAVILSTVLLGLLHQQARRLNPELSHVLADAALAVPMMILVLLS